jgi:hypothetical protein
MSRMPGSGQLRRMLFAPLVMDVGFSPEAETRSMAYERGRRMLVNHSN